MKKSEMFELMDWPADVIGDGPFLLIMITPFEGLRLQRYASRAEASVDWLNYTGPGRAWLFEVGGEVDFEELPSLDGGESL